MLFTLDRPAVGQLTGRMAMRALLIGDVVGKGGRQAVRQLAPALKAEFKCAFCIANGENSAGGAGLTENCAMELKSSDVDVVTSGDHVWDQKEFAQQIDRLPFVLRPANFHASQPGRGYGIFKTEDGTEICVIDVIGRVFVGTPSDCPFAAVDRILAEVQPRCKVVFVEIHGEATSEKIAMGRHLEGRVTAVWGTHTHVPTADERVLPGGTAFQCDVGMVGSRESVLGRDIKAVLHRFTTGMPARFTVVDTDTMLCGAVVDFNPVTGRAVKIERVMRFCPNSG